jgi:hypothetical protein
MLIAILTTPRESEVLDGISRAFFAALDHDGSGLVAGVWGALVLAGAYVIIGWLRGDARSEEEERRELEARRVRIASEAPPRFERRASVRVGSRVEMKVTPAGSPRGPVHVVETHDVGRGGLSFHSEEAPAHGARLRFTLDLGDAKALAVRGTVVRVSPPRHAGARSLVAAKFVDVDSATGERLARWIAEEERREIVVARRGKLCACCERPLADGVSDMHPTCAAARAAMKQAA